MPERAKRLLALLMRLIPGFDRDGCMARPEAKRMLGLLAPVHS